MEKYGFYNTARWRSNWRCRNCRNFDTPPKYRHRHAWSDDLHTTEDPADHQTPEALQGGGPTCATVLLERERMTSPESTDPPATSSCKEMSTKSTVAALRVR